MLKNNNLIVIYGKAGSYKSSIAYTLIDGLNDIACYINLEDNKHLKFNSKIKVFDKTDYIDKEFVEECVADYNIVLVDSIDKLDHKKEDLLYLKELAKKWKTTLILISNADKSDEFKGFADLMIHSKRN
ncbi:MAG: hypothetical protein E7159_04950 [Firmicutes bacterium]|jgi:hypothetical protein|nr:hypothetical protein [Bacillota bacterium]